MAKKVLIPVANGTEEIELAAMVGVFRKGGVEVTIAAVGELQITASRGVQVVADRLLADCVHERYDLIALPGGMPGAEHLRDSATLTEMLKAQHAAGRWIAAICAAPVVVLHHHGLLHKTHATCYPSMMDQLDPEYCSTEKIVVDHHIATSQGPGTAIAFAVRLLILLHEKASADLVAHALLCPMGGGHV